MAEKKEFNMTQEELHKLEEALKKEEFRKLLVDYAKEIRDPENRKKYEEEIAQLERERGQDVQFLSPKPGFVVKTYKRGDKFKVFINVCQSSTVAKATATFTQRPEGKGQNWSIPYSLTTVREDVDHAKAKCSVIDFVINPDTYARGQKDSRFKRLLVDTALEGIETKRGLKLEKTTLHYPKMPYKGMLSHSIVRKPLDEETSSASQAEGDQLPFAVPYPPLTTPSTTDNDITPSTTGDDITTTPHYIITHQGGVDLQDYTNNSSFVKTTRPKQLIISIDLPGLESASSVELDYTTSSLDLYCPDPLYRLNLKLPFKVNEEEGSAKFDKTKQHLIVTLSVLPMETTVVNLNSNIEVLESSPTEDLANEITQTEDVSSSTEHQSVTDCVQSDVTDNHHGNLSVIKSHDARKCPAYSYHQTASDVTFILHVPVVKESTLVKVFDHQQFTMTFTSAEDMSYSFVVVFPEGCVLNVDKCSVDVSQDNVVVMVTKSDKSCTAWQHFKAGTNLVTLQDKQFLTDENVSEQSAMDGSHTHNVADQGVELQARVTELTDESLTITVEQPHPPATRDDDDEPHPPTISNDKPYPPTTEPLPQPSESDSDNPLPLHASSEPRPQAPSNTMPHPAAEDKATNDHQPAVLVPSNQLLFELD